MRRLLFTLVLVAGVSATIARGQGPPGATARCRDGTYSFSQHRRGTCSHHGGVAAWLVPGADSVSSPATDTATSPREAFPVCYAPVELTLCRVDTRLLWLYTEADHDYHLVLASPQDTTVTMIAEVPDPGCAGACASGFAAVYARVRQKLLDYLNSPQGSARPLVRIAGLGLFDFLHGQRGVAPNGIELHPVLDVEFP